MRCSYGELERFDGDQTAAMISDTSADLEADVYSE